MHCLSTAAAIMVLSIAVSTSVVAKDDLLETLAQKGVLTLEEYEKLKAQRQTEVTVNTDEGFKMTSADGTASLQVGTVQQLDAASYRDDRADLANGTELRRSRLSVGGTFFKDWQYRLEYEFSGATGVTDAYVAYAGLKPFIVTVGQFKQPFGMEALAADKNVTFMERGLPFAFVTTRAPGVMLGTSGANWSANGGVFGEPVGNAQAGDEGYGVVGRVTYAPLLTADRVIHLGLGATWREPTDGNSTNATGPRFNTIRFRSKPESNVLAQRFVDTGEIRDVDRYGIGGVEFAAQFGPASLQAEYHLVEVDRDSRSSLNFSAWYAQLAYTLTGEARPYKADRGIFDGIRPAHVFGRDGWGAFELAARVSEIDLSDGDVTGGRERNVTLALNGYLNSFLRVSVNIVKVLEVKEGPFAAEEPAVLQLRMQLAL